MHPAGSLASAELHTWRIINSHTSTHRGAPGDEEPSSPVKPVADKHHLHEVYASFFSVLYTCRREMINAAIRSTQRVKSSQIYGNSSPGRSENSRMHSLKPLARRRSLSCCRMATPMQKGKEELPSSSVSHRWKILCSGNTSKKEEQTKL